MWLHRLRVLEGMAALAAAQVIVRALSFRVFRAFAGAVDRESTSDRCDSLPTDSTVRGVATAIESAANRLPLRSTCLMKAVAGRLMLSWRRVPSRLVLGVSQSNGRAQAHAWLIAGGGAVCGGEESAEFSPIAVFRGRPR